MNCVRGVVIKNIIKSAEIFILSLVLFSLPCYAQEPQPQQPEESLTITTYYPSPYGT